MTFTIENMSKFYKDFLKSLFYVFIAVTAVMGDESNKILYKDIQEDKRNDLSVDKNRDVIIHEIMNKVGDLTLKSWANSTIEEKNKYLDNIREKLEKAAAGFGPKGNMYVEIIMQGIKTSLAQEKEIVNVIQSETRRNTLERKKTFLNSTNSDTYAPKEELINTMIKKIEILVKTFFGNLKTFDEKDEILEKIKSKMNNVLSEINKDQNDINTNKSYKEIIMQGIDMMIKKNNINDTRRNIEYYNKTKNINLNPEEKYKKTTSFSTTIKPSKSGTCDCKCIVKNICEKVKDVNTVICPYDNSVIKLEQVCDNAVDCPDRYDEKDCQQHALESIQKANNLIKEVELSFPQNCESEDSSNILLSQQRTSLANVLQFEVDFINKYTDEYNTDSNYNVKHTAHEVLLVVDAIALAFEGAFCMSNLREIHEDEINEAIDFDHHQIMADTLWSPRLCACNGQYCTKTNCKDACKRICRNKYMLDKWTCEAIDQGSSVTLDLICDGKIDCYDESDEIGCSKGESIYKFEAREIFKNILELLSTKTGSYDFEIVRPLLINLHSCIKNLEKMSAKKKKNNLDLKYIRDKAFKTLSLIYNKVIEQSTAKDEAVDVYKFLTLINNKLIEAIKRTGTGNELIVPAGSCYCRNDKCGIPNCSKQCIRACKAETNITKYSCDKNVFVPIKALCDGIPNCPNGKDEVDCSQDVCRNHNLKLLRDKIKEAGRKYDGTSTGEALKFWKSKVNGTLKMNYKKDRLLKKDLLELVSSILNDLVMAFGSLNPKKNNRENVLKEFSRIAQNIIMILKNCK